MRAVVRYKPAGDGWMRRGRIAGPSRRPRVETTFPMPWWRGLPPLDDLSCRYGEFHRRTARKYELRVMCVVHRAHDRRGSWPFKARLAVTRSDQQE